MSRIRKIFDAAIGYLMGVALGVLLALPSVLMGAG